MFNGHYDTHGYFLLFGFLTFNEQTENYLFAAMLRSGTSPEKVGALALLKRIMPYLKEQFPRARLFVRLDAGFKGPELLDLLDESGVSYAVGLSSNSVLKAASAGFVENVQSQSEKTGKTATRYSASMYAASSWRRKARRVICKAEYLQTPGMIPKTNVRYVVTNLRHKPETVYKIYRQRGEVENRIKEPKTGVQVDRTSCSKFLPNQFRVFLAATAYVIFQELRYRAARTSLKNAQVWTLQLCLMKIGGIIRWSHRRIMIHLAASHPYRDTWLRIARSCGGLRLPRTA